MRPLACGEWAKISSVPHSAKARPTWVGSRPAEQLFLDRLAAARRAEEDRVAVAVHGQRHAVPQDLAQDGEITGGIFLLAEAGAEHLAGGVVDRANQTRQRCRSEPAVTRGVDLHEHAFGGAPRTALRYARTRWWRGLAIPAARRMRWTEARERVMPSRSRNRSVK
jgi:hypothetical protein